ncbi:hypothetical protein SAMN05660845_2443 [Flavobacterium swingsii]|uniref:Uncharacterized protein n=1 Tax=Flavobacterium swingsii TaxID=498292 RepID=A0A1I0ZVV9_9FLAO|nr:hypothetical protein [Flavobacterium swingsii]SFB29206.1 hypothetical protein SAMN05660845_2443 [Flavobacterium swingsii]
MKKIITIIFLFNFLICFSQKKEFANQGEQENYWAEQLFKKEYKKQDFEKFKGKIEILNNNQIKFDNKILNIHCPKIYLPIFSTGIFFPQIIIGNTENNKVLTDEDVAKLNPEERFRYNLNRNDSFSISELEELIFLSNSPKIKRFRFWSFRHGFANPQVYFFELINEKADNKTSIEKFIKNAKLTYFKAGHMVI